MNQLTIKMKRKKFSTRLVQLVVLTVVLSLSLYLLLHPGRNQGTDFSWLSTRNLSVLVRPGEETALVEPQPCRVEEEIRILIAVYSAPRNTRARTVIR